MKPAKVLLTLALSLLIVPAFAEYRSYDGTGNNLAHPDWGSTGSQLLRIGAPEYADGVSSPAGPNRPSPRVISNIVVNQPQSIPNTFGRSDFIWSWGQFLDHDLDHLAAATPREPLPIIVPPGDPNFDPNATGGVVLNFNRSAYDPCTGTDPCNPRQQINVITSWLDGSMVYGSDSARAAWLREGSGGRLKVTDNPCGPLLPQDDGTVPNTAGVPSDNFVAGDTRVNENLALTALHTLFVREHNRLAALIASANPSWTDEQIYQKARKIVSGEINVITFNEFLPALLSPDAPGPYAGYDPNFNPNVANSFAAAAFRFGHSAISPILLRLDENLCPIPYGNLAIEDSFNAPTLLIDQGGIDPILRGLAYQLHQQIDSMVVHGLRNILFGASDLPSINMQRGRDHGLADYNQMRIDYGLAPVTTFTQIAPDLKTQTGLRAVYGTINNIDPWLGLISEGAVPGSLLNAAVAEQFSRARASDRLWYAIDPNLTADEIALIDSARLKDIIERNTGITGLPDNVFFAALLPVYDELIIKRAVITPDTRNRDYDTISIMGCSFDANSQDFADARCVSISIWLDDNSTPVFAKSLRTAAGTYKHGRFVYTGTGPVSYLCLNTFNQTFSVTVNTLNLASLQEKVTIEIVVDSCTGLGSTSDITGCPKNK